MASGEAGGDTGPTYVTDLGETYSGVGYWRDERVEIAEEDGSQNIPARVVSPQGGASGQTDDPGGNDVGMCDTTRPRAQPRNQATTGRTLSGASDLAMAIVLIRVERNGRHS